MRAVDPLKSAIKTRHGGGLRVISTDMANGRARPGSMLETRRAHAEGHSRTNHHYSFMK